MSDYVQNPQPARRRAGVGFYSLWIGLALVAVIAALGVLVVRGESIRSQANVLQQRAGQAQPVLVTKLLQAPETRQITLPGEIHGYYETPIYAKIDGYVKTMLVDKGALVRAGQLVATIESPETDQQVRNAKASYDIAAITDRREQALLLARVVPQQDADQTHAQLLTAKATWRADLAMQQYERVIAPFGGMITARNLHPGALVGSGSASGTSTPGLYEIATLSPLRVYVYLPQPLSTLIRDGDRASIVVSEYPRRDFHGSITRHPEALDQSTRTMLIEVDLPNTDRALYPGMYADVSIILHGNNESPRVPDEALIFDNDEILVPVVRGGRIHLTKVKLGLDDGINSEVTRGLEGNEIVALGLGQAAQEGQLIKPVFPHQP